MEDRSDLFFGDTGVKRGRSRREKPLKDAKRIIVKVGTNLLVERDRGLNVKFIAEIIRQIMELRKGGKEILLVTSGAIGAGKKRLKFAQMPHDTSLKQACAAVGQGILMRTYDEMFEKYEQPIAQVLLTEEDFSSRARYLNLRNTLGKLLDLGVLPVINENDTVSVHELEEQSGWVARVPFSDNDKLSGLVAGKIFADLLVILSDIDGLYDRNPQLHKNAQRIDLVHSITPSIEAMAGANTDGGRGGMVTKLQGAKIAASSGVPVVIANGWSRDVLLRVVHGENIGTLFLPKARRLTAKKRWIAFGSAVRGAIIVNEGARDAMKNRGKSLLPAGIIGCKGEFSRGDVVSLECNDKEFAHGVSQYASSEVRKMMGAQTSEIETILGKKRTDEVVMRQNVVLKEML
ncbi:MAG: glutamate 5-kinase [Acidobacteria bacterium]|nr:glutamate 5-kinase [Acidobacteriota bacterium]